jgi:hypothetical protein
MSTRQAARDRCSCARCVHRVALADVWKRVWSGAREAMRVATYYQMKKRAGIVGQKGLGPLIGQLPTNPETRVTTIGHSFGARLVSFALTGLPDAATGPASPVKGMFLVQGAFSHYSFAKTHPFRNGSGARSPARGHG